jgi:hypothetical protein
MTSPRFVHLIRAFATVTALTSAATLTLSAQTENPAFNELIDVLVGNGQITPAQAEALKKSASATAKPATTAPAPAAPSTTSAAAPKVVAIPKQKETTKLTIAGKFHPMYEWFSTKTPTGADIADRNDFTMRRVELEFTGDIAPDWSATMTADFAASNVLNQAYVSYKGIAKHELRIGQAKVPFLWEESLSDTVIKGVERSPTDRVIVEHPGRGIGSKIAGIHLKGGDATGPYYAVAITNAGAKNASGYAGNVSNELAYWGRVGTNIAAGSGRIDFGADVALQPDYLPGGTLTAYAAHAHFTSARFDVLTEAVSCAYPRPGQSDANLLSFMIEPCFRVTKQWEVVLRYSKTDSDGLGISPTALIRNAPSTGNFDEFDSVYVGGNWYIVGNAVRMTFGYDHAWARHRITGTDSENTIDGLSSRFQFLF